MKLSLILVSALFSLNAHAGVVADNSEYVAKKSSSKKSEPAPKENNDRDEEADPRQGTYEGNDRGGGSFDGGGYEGGGDEGGMIGEIFMTPENKSFKTTSSTTEDRGDVIVYTTTVLQDFSAAKTCTTVNVTTVDKQTGAVISSDDSEFCDSWPAL